jgi:hypothetical protein
VFFRRSDVVLAGDVLDTRRFPVIDIERGGSIEGEIAALSRLADIAVASVPIVSREAGTMVIPVTAGCATSSTWSNTAT